MKKIDWDKISKTINEMGLVIFVGIIWAIYWILLFQIAYGR